MRCSTLHNLFSYNAVRRKSVSAHHTSSSSTISPLILATLSTSVRTHIRTHHTSRVPSPCNATEYIESAARVPLCTMPIIGQVTRLGTLDHHQYIHQSNPLWLCPCLARVRSAKNEKEIEKLERRQGQFAYCTKNVNSIYTWKRSTILFCKRHLFTWTAFGEEDDSLEEEIINPSRTRHVWRATHVFPADLPARLFLIKPSRQLVSSRPKPHDNITLDRPQRTHTRCTRLGSHRPNRLFEFRTRRRSTVIRKLAMVQVAFENDELGFGDVEEDVGRFGWEVPECVA